ncbi:retinol dehydrogenase 13-like [Artemia franciscana]|uniref:retinol dehydrogenase 13-like n=1 Tax=Artemia franciscana TaxID=6661 RepID=UPI0032DA8776
MVTINKLILTASAGGTCIGGLLLLKDALSGKIYEGKERIDGKVVIVTGANSGIGKETVKELANRGGKVYMACRDLQKCEEERQKIVLETKNKSVYCRECDLASQESVKEFVKTFKKEQQHLHILVNNAGVMKCPRLVTQENIELQLGVNHMGHFLLTNLLLDYLKESAPSRIVNVSSVAHARGRMKWSDLNSEIHYDKREAYNQSKLANVMFTMELSKRLQGTGVTANALHPGLVDTNIIRYINESAMGRYILALGAWPFIRTPQRGAQTVLYACLDPQFEKVSGKYLNDCEITSAAPQSLDEKNNLRLWLTSEKWTRLQAALNETGNNPVS